MWRFLKKHWLAVAIWALLIFPTANFLLASAALITYMYWPFFYGQESFAVIDFSQFKANQSHMVVLAHGVKDDPNTWIKPLEATYEQAGYRGQIIGIDWSAYAQGTLRCAISGKRIGRLIGERIAADENIRSVHFIGHSCGAFVIYGACQAVKQHRKTISVQATYLDPVSVYGLFWDYGVEHFGDCGDYSEAYIDTEDGVPGSNQLLPHCHTYDVTAVRKRSDYHSTPHMWPVHYYQQLVATNRAPDLRNDAALPNVKPAGILEIVE